MLHNIEPRKFNNRFENRIPNIKDRILSYKNNTVLVRRAIEKLWYPSFLDYEDYFEILINKAKFVFSVDDINYFLVDSNLLTSNEEFVFVPIDSFRIQATRWRAFVGVTGWQLYRWYNNYKFCGRCGNLLIHSHHERLLECKNCDNKIYPLISPCVIVAVYKNNRLLVTKYLNSNYKNYALIAGFVEVGESLEQTVHREVIEEVGLSVKNLQFYKSQPWSFSDTILVGFFAELDGSDSVNVQEDELSEAVWLDRDEIPEQENSISLTSEMIAVFKSGFKYIK